MKIKWEGFLGTNHSWAIVGQNISRSLIARGHDVHLVSTNGIEHLPPDLRGYIRARPEASYDVQLTYTALKNFPNYLDSGRQNRFGIWNYETTVLPPGFAKFYSACDLVLPSSEFSKRIFADAGIPESHMRVVPHGVNIAEIESATPFKLKTKKRVKILANIAQPHVRKNMKGLLAAFGKAFTKNDDVCLVLKVVTKKPSASHEESFTDIFKVFRGLYPNHAEVEIVSTFLPNIYDLYKACDFIWTMTYAECFWMPGLEGMACGTIPIAPRYGGQLDFMNDDNSLLIDGKVIPAPPKIQYWANSPHAKVFDPNMDEAVTTLRHAVAGVEELKFRWADKNKVAALKCNWDSVVDTILSYVNKS